MHKKSEVQNRTFTEVLLKKEILHKHAEKSDRNTMPFLLNFELLLLSVDTGIIFGTSNVATTNFTNNHKLNLHYY
jgi:hypothetical protein